MKERFQIATYTQIEDSGCREEGRRLHVRECSHHKTSDMQAYQHVEDCMKEESEIIKIMNSRIMS